MATLASRIKSLRQSAGMTQTEFGEKFGIVKSTVSLYEGGKSNPNDEIKARICEFFNVSMDYLVGISEVERDNSTRFDAKTLSSNANGNAIAYHLSKTGLGIDEAAECLGVNSDVLYDISENSMRPSTELLMKLAELCNVSTDCLLNMRHKTRKRESSGEMPFYFSKRSSLRLKEVYSEISNGNSHSGGLYDLSEDELNNLLDYGFLPHVNALIKLSKACNVSIDYALSQSNSRLCIENRDEERLLQAFRKLSEDNRLILLGDALKEVRTQEMEESEKNVSVAADVFSRTGTDNMGK